MPSLPLVTEEKSVPDDPESVLKVTGTFAIGAPLVALVTVALSITGAVLQKLAGVLSPPRDSATVTGLPVITTKVPAAVAVLVVCSASVTVAVKLTDPVAELGQVTVVVAEVAEAKVQSERLELQLTEATLSPLGNVAVTLSAAGDPGVNVPTVAVALNVVVIALAEKALRPLGVPRPVGPSHPVVAVQSLLPEQLPLLPEVMSLRPVVPR